MYDQLRPAEQWHFMKWISFQEGNEKLTFIEELAGLNPYTYFNLPI